MRTNKIVGLGAVGLRVDLQFFDAVRDDPLGGLKEPCRLRHVPPRIFQGIDDQLFFKIDDLAFEGPGRDCPGSLPGLKGRGQMVAVNHPVVTENDGPFDTILKLPNIARPVVLHEHVNRGG